MALVLTIDLASEQTLTRAREAGPRHASRRTCVPPQRWHYLRRRAVVALVLASVGLAIGMWAHRADATGAAPPVEVRVVTVAPGETLWHYAAKIAGSERDVRDVVIELQRLNGMTNTQVRAGQLLSLPQSHPHDS